jgi:serine/threonine-protein kinase
MSESTPENSAPQTLKINGTIENPYEPKQVPMPVAGDKIGPNRVQVLIGEGGSANVYKVWHEGLEVIRAVKVLKKAYEKETRERFLTEAKILADIHHPNIVEIHNIGYYNQNIPFIEMEFVDGTSLKSLISQQTSLPLTVAISVVYFICQALQYAHIKDYTLYGKVYKGFIHRDIKPDNIILSRDGIIKLMDFGIARPSEVSLHTIGQKIMGTLVYLSPEQLNGKTLDHRTDIFSLGTVLYELITGQRAFPQKTLSELVQKKTKGIYKSLESYPVDLPPKLVEIVEKSMALEPEDRYAHISDFGHDLFTVLTGMTDRSPNEILSRFAADPSSISQWKPTIQSNRKLIITCSIAAGIVIGGDSSENLNVE